MISMYTKKAMYLREMIERSSGDVPGMFTNALLAFNVSMYSIQLQALTDVLETKQVIPAGAVDVEFTIRLDQYISLMERKVREIDAVLNRDSPANDHQKNKKP